MSTSALLTRRVANATGLAASAGMMGFALYAEHVLALEPCPLCVFQRMATIGLATMFLLALVHDPRSWGSRLYALLIAIAAGVGATVAGRHVWIQNLPPDEVPACGAGLDYLMNTMPLTDVIREVFTGSGECAELKWSFLGLSMPAWVLVCMVLLGLLGLAANLVLPAKREQRL